MALSDIIGIVAICTVYEIHNIYIYRNGQFTTEEGHMGVYNLWSCLLSCFIGLKCYNYALSLCVFCKYNTLRPSYVALTRIMTHTHTHMSSRHVSANVMSKIICLSLKF